MEADVPPVRRLPPDTPNPQPDPVFLLRKVRDDEEAWQSAKSWFGGLPAIEPDRWPRSPRSGLPLYHLAHIDLSEVPHGREKPKLPSAGTLSFFLDPRFEDDKPECAVIYCELNSTSQLKLAPPELPPLLDEYGRPVHLKEGGAAQTYRRWPMQFFLGNAKAEDMADNLPETPESIHFFPEHLMPDFDVGQLPWDAVPRILSQLQAGLSYHDGRKGIVPEPWLKMTQEEYDQKWLSNNSKMQAVRDLVDRWTEKFVDAERWSPMGSELAKLFDAEIADVRRTSGIHIGYGSGTSALRDAASNSYRDMLTETHEIYERIPANIREYLEAGRRASGWSHAAPHQMFGYGGLVQSEPEDFGDNILLFSASSDDMLSWMWGDVGVVCFFIAPSDLAAKRWDKAWAHFEGH